MAPVHVRTCKVAIPRPFMREDLELFPCIDPAFPVLAGSVDADLVHFGRIDPVKADFCRTRVDGVGIDDLGNSLDLLGVHDMDAYKTKQDGNGSTY